MEDWKVSLLQSIRSIEHAHDTGDLNDEERNELTEVIVKLQMIMED
ncbi:hypothetical protein Amet_2830 [Alkaliphilus metalliredigens QYMF]|uniref:Uncharacterized protein n=1 Tax=Alkaliphilus metalliredigens (strain QYMF) TaxID=293826 RepID=A6TS12_ALKMQ|nr:hypothetical protein [Alkaliphilus metalliredigens]ABR48980.1 hypothetical protein Amet_2830 [Alkaliphilus metalliredigens QYMF]